MLTSDQKRAFGENGFVLIEDVFGADRLAALREACDAPKVKAVHQRYRPNEKLVHLLQLSSLDPQFRELIMDPMITERVASLIGPDIQLQHSKLCTKPPLSGCGAFPWHQDFSFNPHTNADLVTVILALDDADVDNGCITFLEGSHGLGPLNHSVDGWHATGCQEPCYWEETARHVSVPMRAGSMTIHHAFTLHSSPNTQSGLPRRYVAFHYRADDAYQLAGQVYEDTGIMVHGSRRGRVRCDPWVLELPRRQGWEAAHKNAFGNVYAQQGAAAR